MSPMNLNKLKGFVAPDAAICVCGHRIYSDVRKKGVWRHSNSGLFRSGQCCAAQIDKTRLCTCVTPKPATLLTKSKSLPISTADDKKSESIETSDSNARTI